MRKSGIMQCSSGNVPREIRTLSARNVGSTVQRNITIVIVPPKDKTVKMLEKFPEKLKSLRERHGLLQKQLAKQLGITELHISYLENKRRKPGAELVLKVADFFGVTTDVLMRDELDLDADDEP
jgi:DNA-binding XRE family transcriptional regulator